MSLFDESPTIESLLARIEALEAQVFEQGPKSKRTECPEELEPAWRKWHGYRQVKRGWTAEAKRLNLGKLVELAGRDCGLAMRIVEQSIEHGWQTLYPLKNAPQGATATSGPPSVVQIRRAEETPLERALGFLRHQRRLDQITEDEFQAATRAAQLKHGRGK